MEAARDCASALLLPPPRASPRVCPPVRARAREVAGGCARSCSLCSLTPVAAPTHCTPAPPPSDRGCSLSLPRCLSVSLALLSGSLPLALLSGFFPQEPAEVPPGRRFCPIRPDCRNPRTAAFELPALLLLPHGPASLRRCCCRRRRRVEGDPDPTLFLRPDKNAQKPHTTKTAVCRGRVSRPGRCCCSCRRCCCWETSWAS